MSSSIYYSANSAVGVGAESTYGTAAARTVWFYPTNCTLRPNMTRQVRDYTRSSATSFNDFDDYVAFRGWSGNVTLELTYDNCGLLLRQAIGAGTTTGPVGSIYQHTFKRALAFPTSLTFEVNRGVTAKDLYAGGKVMRATISQDVSSGKPAILSLDMIGTTHTRSDSPASVTARTNETLLHYSHAVSTAGNLNFNSANYPWKRYELTIDNGLAERRFNGSLYTQEPLRNAKEDIRLSATVDVYDVLLDGYEAGTQGDVSLTWNDPDSLCLFVLTGHNGKLYDVSDSNISGSAPGVFESTLMWKMFSDGTDDGVSAVVDNRTTTSIGNG